jgi:hypothetical protein
MKPKALAVALLLSLAVGAGTALAQSATDADRFFGLEWSGGERRGRPNVKGYVVNNARMTAANVRLIVESLDAAGKTTATTAGLVPDVPPGGRVYFEVPVKQRAPRYRVTITGWDWREARGQ